MGDLRVELYGRHAGDLVGTDWRSFDFRTSSDAYEAFPLNSAHGIEKYQNKGGKVSLRRIAGVFLNRGDTESAQRLLKITVMSVALGNLDLHAKNISLLHPFAGPATLAPAYDVVPQTHQDNDHEMALAINGKYLHADICAADLVEEAVSWGLTGAKAVVSETLQAVMGIAQSEVPLTGSYEGLREDTLRFTGNLLDDRTAGNDGPIL
ncbi:MAG: HipA domain-containing protein [Microbacteriaceae bacterium]